MPDQYGGTLKKHGDQVIYQIYPRSFKDSDRNGQGDINGITSMLDYIKTLEVDAIWISPMYKSPPGPAGDGGYAVEDHRSIDPVYGAHEDFQNLLSEAHGRGLKVYMDFVLPHTAHTHKWFEASRDPTHPEHEQYKDFYVWHKGHHLIDGKSYPTEEAKIIAKERGVELPEVPLVPNNWKSVFGTKGKDDSAWTWDSKREAFYMHHFLQSQPAVNLNLEHVQDRVFDDMQYWIHQGVDGFRLDSLPFANYDPEFRDNEWLHGQFPYHDLGWEDQKFTRSMCQDSTNDLIRRMRARFMDAMLMGEVIAGVNGGRDSIKQAADYVKAGLDSCYTTYGWAIGSSQADYIRDLLTGIVEKFPNGGVWLPVSTHDCYEKSPRTYTRIAEYMGRIGQGHHLEEAYRQALQIFATFGGFSIYQMDELGVHQAQMGKDIKHEEAQDPLIDRGAEWSRDVVRTPFPSDSTKKNAGFSDSDKPYLPVAESHRRLAVDIQQGNPDSTLVFTQNLIRWRKQQPALKHGKVKMLQTNGDTVAFIRESEEQIILCAFNLGPHEFFFRPADVLDGAEVQKLGLPQDFIFYMKAYDGQFASRAKPQMQHDHQHTHAPQQAVA